jgi:drug/metabolite transporter (DMT)-like permease
MSRKGWLLLVALGVIWGVPYLLIRVAVTDYHPVIVAFGRAVLGAAILMPFALKRGTLLSGFRKPGWLATYTLAEISGPWILIGYAELHVASSTAGLIVALTPIVATALGTISSARATSLRRSFGLGLGLTGVAALLGFDTGQPHWLAFAALTLSALGYAIGPMIVARKLSDEDSLGVVVASLVVAAVVYLPAVPAHWPQSFSIAGSLSVLALAAICTSLAFVVLFALIAEVSAERATIVAYLNPAVAVLLGVVVLGEPFTLGMALGLGLIVSGTFLATHQLVVEASNKRVLPVR